MSENPKPTAVEQKPIAPLSLQRVLWTMVIVTIIAAIISSIFISARFGLGFAIGGILALLNYYWLRVSLKNVFDKAISGDKPQFLAGSYFLRYLAIGAIVLVIYLMRIVPVIALLFGLSVFALAIVVEGLIRIFSPISKQEEF
jgi:hypothetical protein